jgi:hypothetical protein
LTKFHTPGNPGAKFKNVYEKMVKALQLPKGAREELGLPNDVGGQLLSQKGGSQTDMGDVNDKS